MNVNAMTQNIFPLADALLMDMKFYANAGKVHGAVEMELPLVAAENSKDDLLLTIHPKIISSFVSETDAAVLVKVRKRVWLFLWYNKPTRSLTLQMLDADILNLHENHGIATVWDKQGGVANAAREFARGTKATFFKEELDTKWKRLNEDLDNLGGAGGNETESEQDHRAAG